MEKIKKISGHGPCLLRLGALKVKVQPIIIFRNMLIMLITWTVFSINKTNWTTTLQYYLKQTMAQCAIPKRWCEDVQRRGEEEEGMLFSVISVTTPPHLKDS